MFPYITKQSVRRHGRRADVPADVRRSGTQIVIIKLMAIKYGKAIQNPAIYDDSLSMHRSNISHAERENVSRSPECAAHGSYLNR
jgi:hypothetical protein